MSAPRIFDRMLIRAHRRRAANIGPATFLLDHVGGELAQRLDAVTRRFELTVDLGTPGKGLRDALVGHPCIGRLITANPLAHAASPDRALGVTAHEELLPFADGALDLVVSALSLQLVNDLPGALAQIRRALRPDGLFLAALIGGDTLIELRQSFAEAEAEIEGGASPHVAPFADVRSMGMLLQRAGFALPVCDLDRLTVRYDTAFALAADLRRMGATNPLVARRRTPARRATLIRMAEIYARRFADPDGRIRATFDVIWLSGWAPHESQQQPLKPGSATMRLAEALGTREVSAGEKAR